MITIKIGNIESMLDGFVPSQIWEMLDSELSYKTKGVEYTKAYNEIKEDGERAWDGRTRLLKNRKNGLFFPSGTLARVRKILDDQRMQYTFEDCRPPTVNNITYPLNEKVKFHDYQSDAINKCLETKRGIVKVATGGGKTHIAGGIISKAGVTPWVFFVNSRAVLHQTARALENKILGEESIGIVGDGICDIRNITVMTMQTAAAALGEKKKDIDEEDDDYNDEKEQAILQKKADILNLIKGAEGIIVDEAHHTPARLAKAVCFAAKNARARFGLSASPWRDDGDDLLIEACFGKRIVDIEATYLINRGFLVRPTIYMPHMRCCLGSFKTYQNIYSSYIVDNDKRNEVIADYANICREQKKPTMILVKQIKHGKILNDLLPDAVFIKGEDSTKQRDKAINSIVNRNKFILIATALADEGLDIPCLERGILAGSGKSSTKAFQRLGRFLRVEEGKTEAKILDFMDYAKYISEHSRRRLKLYSTESGFIIVKDFPPEIK